MYRMLASGSLAVLVVALLLLVGCSHNNSAVNYLVSIEPNGLTLKAGETVTISPDVTANGQQVQNPTFTWSVTGDIGTIANGVFTAVSTVSSDAPKSGTIEAVGYGQTVSIPVTVTVGDLAELEIVSPEGVDLTQVVSGTSLTFSAIGEDNYGNRGATRFAVTPTWSVTGGIGTITAEGVFTAGTAGTGAVVATVGQVQASVAITVIAGAVHHVVIITPQGFDPNHVVVGDVCTVTATGADMSGNRKASRLPLPAAVQWSVTGNIGTITANGQFTATAMGEGKIVAVSGDLRGELPIHVVAAFRGNIAFERTTGVASSLGTMAGDGTTTPLSELTSKYTYPSWSPDGTKLVFVSNGGDYTGICVMNVATKAIQQITDVVGKDPVFSPDGTKIAYSYGTLMAGEIRVIDLAGNLLKTVATGLSGTPRFPTWSPDGSKIAFCINSGLGLSDGVYTANADGTGDIKQIFTGAANDVEWTSALSHVIVSTTHRIIRIATTGSAVSDGEELVADSGTLRGGFALAPNSSAIVYGVLIDGLTQLRVKHITSGQTLQITNLVGASAQNPSWK